MLVYSILNEIRPVLHRKEIFVSIYVALIWYINNDIEGRFGSMTFWLAPERNKIDRPEMREPLEFVITVSDDTSVVGGESEASSEMKVRDT